MCTQRRGYWGQLLSFQKRMIRLRNARSCRNWWKLAKQLNKMCSFWINCSLIRHSQFKLGKLKQQYRQIFKASFISWKRPTFLKDSSTDTTQLVNYCKDRKFSSSWASKSANTSKYKTQKSMTSLGWSSSPSSNAVNFHSVTWVSNRDRKEQ